MKASVREVWPHLTPRERDRLTALAQASRRPAFCDPNFPEQTAFMRDPARLKVLLCTRRSGKSYGEGAYLFQEAYEHPGVSVLYVGLTRDSAKRIMWKDVLEPLNERLGMNAKANLTELSMTLPNGSVIYLIGLDSSEKEKRKVFGQKFRLAVIDEAALYSIDLRELVYGVLKPAMIDHGGTICLSGMPSNLKRGLFFDLTAGLNASVPGVTESVDAKHGARWVVHRWSAWQNPYVLENWLAEVAEMRAINPHIDETPLFQQEYLGRWVVDTTKLVYRYDVTRNDFDGTLPTYAHGRWHYVLACDLGFNDPTSLTALAYHDHDPTTYALRSEKRGGLIISAVADWVREWQAIYDFDEYVIDNANKQAVQEMVQRHSIPWQAADKTGKADFIELMNNDFILGKIKIDLKACAALVGEYATLIWNARTVKREEDPSLPNHCSDGALYGWRKLYGYLSSKIEVPPEYGSEEWSRRESEASQARLVAKIREKRAMQDEEDGWFS